MTPHLIILSAQCVENSLRMDFGEISPVELPIGQLTLLEIQVERFKYKHPGGCVTLVVSETSKRLATFANGLNIDVTYVPDALNLGDLWCLLPKLFPDNIVQILYGDTLVDFESFDEQEWLGVSEKAHFSDSFSKLNERFISGYFSLRVSRLKALSDNNSAVDFDSVLQHLTQHNIPKRNINGWLDFGSLTPEEVLILITSLPLDTVNMTSSN